MTHRGAENTAIQFCPSCNNLLYPQEDVIHKCLDYVCRRVECGQKVAARASLVEGHDLRPPTMSGSTTQGQLGGGIVNKKDLAQHGDDPTLQRVTSETCRCGNNLIVRFMNPYRLDPEDMGLICVCTVCRDVWDQKKGQGSS